MEKNYFIKKLPKDYDYSLLPNDVKCKSYVDIICLKHGIINMRLDVLLRGGFWRSR
jgi:hypothetical protein